MMRSLLIGFLYSIGDGMARWCQALASMRWPQAPLRRGLRLVGLWVGPVVLCLLMAEVASRVDDLVFSGVPLGASPDRERDLLVQDEYGVRGRPHGRYQRWSLNSFGFRGPEIEYAPSKTRLMVLGASETFGLYESEGQEYPSNLQRELARAGLDVEVINASVAGMALPSMIKYWDSWASRFRPQFVLLYPSPQFYLDTEPPRAGTGSPEPRPPSGMSSRFLARLKDQAKTSPLLRSVRTWWVVHRRTRTWDRTYFFSSEPALDRLDQFEGDLAELATRVAHTGAVPVLVTHAFKMPRELSRADRAELEYYRVFFPRALAEAFCPFEDAARTRMMELASRRGWPLIDAARPLSGRRELFADPVHFNDDGSGAMGRLLAGALVRLLEQRGVQRHALQ